MLKMSADEIKVIAKFFVTGITLKKIFCGPKSNIDCDQKIGLVILNVKDFYITSEQRWRHKVLEFITDMQSDKKYSNIS